MKKCFALWALLCLPVFAQNVIPPPGGGSGGGITALTGDGTASGTGSIPFTLATSGVSAGNCGDSTHSCGLTVDAKGRVTALANTSISGGGGGASSVPQLTDLQTTRTSSTVLGVATGNVVVSGISYSIAPGSVGISVGTGIVRIAVDTSVVPPIGKVYFSAGLTATCSGMGGCTSPVSGSAFGPDDLQLATWTVTTGTFDSSGGTELRGMISRSRTAVGSGISSSISGHTQTLAVNTAVLPIFTLIPGTGAALASATSITPTNRSHHVTGITAINTLVAAGMIDGEKLTLIPDGLFTLGVAGNIALAQTAVVSQSIVLTWDSTAVKWYPVVAGATGGGITALTGDGTASGTGSIPFTLATSGVSAGNCGDSTHSCGLTVDAKGRVTALANTSISGGGGGASSVPQLTDLQTTRTSSTVLGVATGNVMVGGVSYSISAGTIGVSAGTGTVRVAVDTSATPPVGKIYYSAGLTVTCAGMGGCTSPVSGAAFGIYDLQLATWTVTTGTFDSSGGTELRGMLSRNRTLTGSGLVSATSGHTQTISVNTAVIPIFTLAPGTGSVLASASSVSPTSLSHHVSGTSTVSTITATGMIDGEILTLIPDAAFATNTSGNIALASTGVVNRAIRFVWDATAAKWYPSY